MLAALNTLPFRVEEARAYGAIVARSGFSRPRILDRMIAATALVADATLVTSNPRDFADIAQLKLEAW
jgi:tRNA(fMet)-specific endonuclease VapC